MTFHMYVQKSVINISNLYNFIISIFNIAVGEKGVRQDTKSGRS